MPNLSVSCQPVIDVKHKKWLHLRIRTPQLPQQDAGSLASRSPMGSRAKAKRVADGRWTLAFSDEATCLMAHAEVMRAMREQSEAVQRCISPLLSDAVVDETGVFSTAEADCGAVQSGP